MHVARSFSRKFFTTRRIVLRPRYIHTFLRYVSECAVANTRLSRYRTISFHGRRNNRPRSPVSNPFDWRRPRKNAADMPSKGTRLTSPLTIPGWTWPTRVQLVWMLSLDRLRIATRLARVDLYELPSLRPTNNPAEFQRRRENSIPISIPPPVSRGARKRSSIIALI